MIPGTDILADVAAEEPVIDAGAQLRRDRPPKLDCQVANTAPGVEDVGLHEGGGRAGVEAGRAGAAVVGIMRIVVIEFDVGQQCGEKEPTAKLLVQQQSVLPDPAEAGQLGEFSFQEGRGVHDAADACARRLTLEKLG